MPTTKKVLLTLLIFITTVIAYVILQQQISTLRHHHYLMLSQQMNDQAQRMIEAKSKSVLGIALALSKDKAIHELLNNKLITATLNKDQFNLSQLLKKHTRFKNVWIQVIDSEGISRSRSWTEKHGDSVLAARLDIQQAIKQPRIIENISVGKFTMSFKSMVPIFNSG